MTISFPTLKDEKLRVFDAKHSAVLSKENSSFTLTDGESEFTVEQIATSTHRSPLGWIVYFLLQLLTALPRAIAFRKPIFMRCNPILLTAQVRVKSFRFSDLTLFLDPGGYNIDVHSYQPPVLTGDKELSIQVLHYSSDQVSVASAIGEEKMSKIGYCIAMFIVPVFLVILTFVTNFGIFFAIALGLLPFLIAFTALAIGHSKRVQCRLREKVEDTLRFLNSRH